MQFGCGDPCLQELGLGHYDERVLCSESRHMLDSYNQADQPMQAFGRRRVEVDDEFALIRVIPFFRDRLHISGVLVHTASNFGKRDVVQAVYTATALSYHVKPL